MNFNFLPLLLLRLLSTRTALPLSLYPSSAFCEIYFNCRTFAHSQEILMSSYVREMLLLFKPACQLIISCELPPLCAHNGPRCSAYQLKLSQNMGNSREKETQQCCTWAKLKLFLSRALKYGNFCCDGQASILQSIFN